MSTSHTPGPWMVGPLNGRQDIMIVDALDTTFVARAIWSGSQDEQVANARLIAAAPELLAVVQAFSERLGAANPTVAWEPSLRALLDRVQAVIAATTGEAQS